MKLIIDRAFPKANYTVGRLYINGKLLCNTLEDTDRGLTQDMFISEIIAKKVYGKTAIPKGTYEVVISWSNKFKKNMLEVKNVKGFSGIRIHSGNTVEDTYGCPLVGKNTIKGQLTSSRACAEVLFNEVQQAINRHEKVTLEIV
jgi:hypothetical protein